MKQSMITQIMTSSSSSSLQVPCLELDKEEDMVSMISHEKVLTGDLHSYGTSNPWQQPTKLRRVQLKKSTNTRYKGVVSLSNGHHGAQIYTNHERIWLGTFKTDIDAAMAYDSAAIKLRSDDLSRNIPSNSTTAQETAFQSHLSKEAVLSMIKDGTYQSRFEDYLRNYQHADAENRMGLGTSPGHGYSAKGGGSQQLFQKELTLSDVGKLNRLVIPKKYAVRHFPRLCNGMDSQPVTLYDRQIKPWTFRYCYWKSSQSFVFTKGWNRFVKEKQLKAGHVITFYKCEVVKGTGEIKTVTVIDDGKDNNLCFVKTLEELEVKQAPPLNNHNGVRLFGVQIG